jgi:hypothetical protein
MIRRALTIVFAVVLASGWAGAAWSVDGGKADPTNDVFDGDAQRFGPGHLDIVKVTHHDDGERLTYAVRTAHQWTTTDLEKVFLNIERLPGLPQYDCQQVSAFVIQKNGKLDGYIHQCLGSGGGQEGGPGGTKTLGPVTATHAENTDTITFSFALSVLRDAGFTGSSYNYSIVMEEKIASDNWDRVPGGASHDTAWITHTFSQPPTPVPTVAATLEPTAQPTAAPTAEPIPEPAAEPTPDTATPQPDAMSFAAPQEHTTDDGTSTPLRVAAVGSVVAGAGIALVRFWPF